jgi:biotin carboxyl carrier protein
MKWNVTLDGVERSVDVRAGERGWLVSVDGGPERAILGARARGTRWRLAEATAEHEGREIDVALRGDAAFVLFGDRALRGTVVDARRAALDMGVHQGAGAIVSPMPGAVVRVLVEVGATVVKGQILVVVEAMKMENELRAAMDGTVASVPVSPGQAVEAGATLVVLQA